MEKCTGSRREEHSLVVIFFLFCFHFVLLLVWEQKRNFLLDASEGGRSAVCDSASLS